MKILLDMDLFLGNYPEESSVMDHRGHQSFPFRAPGNIIRIKGLPGSGCMYKTKCHSSRMRHISLNTRDALIRNEGLSKPVMKRHGYKFSYVEEVRKRPIDIFALLVHSRHNKIPSNVSGLPVVSSFSTRMLMWFLSQIIDFLELKNLFLLSVSISYR